MPDLAATKAIFAQWNDSAGFVTFATVIVAIQLGMANVKGTYKHMPRMMVWLDALAFAEFYIGTLSVDPTDSCSNTVVGFVADFVWAFKDAAKYGYLVFRTLRLWNIEAKWPVWMTSFLSLLFYFIYMGNAYNFARDCNGASTGHIDFTWTLALLYTYWLFITSASSVMLIKKVRDAVAHASTAGFSDGRQFYANILAREEARVCSVCLVHVVSCVIAIMGVEQQNLQFPINAILFTNAQLVLVLSTFDGKKSDSNANEGTRPDASGSKTVAGRKLSQGRMRANSSSVNAKASPRRPVASYDSGQAQKTSGDEFSDKNTATTAEARTEESTTANPNLTVIVEAAPVVPSSQ